MTKQNTRPKIEPNYVAHIVTPRPTSTDTGLMHFLTGYVPGLVDDEGKKIDQKKGLS